MNASDDTKQPPRASERTASRKKRVDCTGSLGRLASRWAATIGNAAPTRFVQKCLELFFPERRRFAQLFRGGWKAMAARDDLVREPAIDETLGSRRQGQFGDELPRR